jgi:hypothetical protein
MDAISLLHFLEMLGEPAIPVRGYFTFYFAGIKWTRSCQGVAAPRLDFPPADISRWEEIRGSR